MARFFLGIYESVQRHRQLFWVLLACSTLVWIGLAIQLKVEGDLSRLMPKTKGEQKVLDQVLSRTAVSERILIEIQALDDHQGAASDSLFILGTSLKKDLEEALDPWIQPTAPGAGDPMQEIFPVLMAHFPLFLEESDYEAMDAWLQPDALMTTMAQHRERLISSPGPFWKEVVEGDPFGLSRNIWPRLEQIRQDTNWDMASGFMVHRSQPKLAFVLQPQYAADQTRENGELLEALSQWRSAWKQENPGYDLLYFGAPLVAAGNALQMQKDTRLTLGLTLGLLLLVTGYYFRRKRASFYLLVPVIYGGLMGLGLTYLIQGSISGIALGAGALILGIAMDFSIHYLSAARNASGPPEVIARVAQPLILGSITTMAAFYALRFTQAPVLQDFGLFASLCLLGAALATLILLPQLPFKAQEERPRSPSLFDRLASISWERKRGLVWVILLITPVLAYFSTKVRFDADMMHLNYLTEDLQEAEAAFQQSHAFTLGTVYVWAEGESAAQALTRLQEVKEPLTPYLESGKVRSMVLPSDWMPPASVRAQRWERWNKFWANRNLKDIEKHALAAAETQGIKGRVVSDFIAKVHAWPSPWGPSQEAALATMFPGALAELDGQFYALASLKLPDEHRETIMNDLSQAGTWTVTDRKEQANALGVLLTEDFSRIAAWSSLIVFFALWIGYGRLELALISFLPLAMSWIWILGMMGLFQLPFNMVNMVISSLLFGLGDDYAIFIMDGLVERNKNRRYSLAGVRSAVYLSVTTVIIALGVLLLAQHPALRSIAWISVVGILCVLLIAQVILPFLFRWLISSRVEKGWPPFTFRSLLISSFAFVYFFIGSMLLTVGGWIWLKLRPMGREGSQRAYHRAISAMTWSMMYVMGNVRKNVPPRSAIDPNRPAIYVANHSSFLDILITTMLHPRLILLTNRWVWRSPVFGLVVRMAQYYPVEASIDLQENRLKARIAQGYSLMIFPEGTRSSSGQIRRFHKGAFFWSEKLNIPVIPMVLHGLDYTMTKGDWMLKDGQCSVVMGPVISPDDQRWGKDYQQKTRVLRRWMTLRLDGLRQEKETPYYYRDRFHKAYTYKGPVLEWYARTKARLEAYYQPFHEIVDREGRFYDLGCGYGFLSWMLHWSAPGREFVGVDYDEEKISLAQGINQGQDPMVFEHGDILTYPLKPARGIFLLDVLHYLLPDQQEQMVRRAYQALEPGGKLVIRDGMMELSVRLRATKLTEWFSTRLIGFNKKRHDLHYPKAAQIRQWAEDWGARVEVQDHGGWTANLTMILTRPLGVESTSSLQQEAEQ